MKNTLSETSPRFNPKKLVGAGIAVLIAGAVIAGGICGSGNCDVDKSEPSEESFATNSDADTNERETAMPSLYASVGPSQSPLSTIVPTRSLPTNPNTIPTPTPSPSAKTTPNPTPSPTKMPTLNSTPLPTKMPTPNPTPSPTKMPTPNPTPLPTKIPTPNPTPLPTKIPTPNPTPLPTKMPTPNPTPSPTKMPTPNPTPIQPSTPFLDGESGAIVTTDCLFQDYGYAIDIYWSCGSEKFNNPLRLHTFKRHSLGHKLIFADQKITYRERVLWFEEYSTPRCISISDGDLTLDTVDSKCHEFVLDGSENGFIIRQVTTGECITFGSSSTNCDDDKSTGGRECGGVDHRFLPLGMGSCNEALTFRFETTAEDCTNGKEEFPGNSCF